MRFRSGFPSFIFALTSLASGAEPAWQPVRPVMEKYCFECHGGKKTKGGVNLKELADDPKVAGKFELWEKVQEAMEAGDMPPEDDPQLNDGDKELVAKWLGHSLESAAHANAGDPGPVTVRRLTNAEYDRTVRNLTGVDFGFGKEFLPDGGGGEGFSNIGDVLFVSPQQVDKYLSAARKLTEHAAILPGRGIVFQETRVGLRSADQLRDQTEQGLYVWYQKMAEPFVPKTREELREADYLLACWKFQHKDKTGAQSLDQLAAEAKLFPPFLANWWDMLHSEKPASRFLDLTRLPWRALPPPSDANPKEVPAEVRKAIAEIAAQRQSWTNQDKYQGWVNTQRRQQDSDGLRPYETSAIIHQGQPIHLVVGDTGDGNKGDWIIIEKIALEPQPKKYEGYPTWLKRKLDVSAKEIAALEASPTPDQKRIAALKKLIADGQRVLPMFGKHPLGKPLEPDALVLQAPATLTLPFEGETKVTVKGRLELSAPEADLASAQFAVTGSHPPAADKIIPGALVLWKRQTPMAGRTMSDFGRMKIAFPDEYERRLQEVARNYKSKDGKGEGVYYLSDAQLTKFISAQEQDRHQRMTKDWRIIGPKKPDANLLKAWDEGVLAHLHFFAAKAWRRPLAGDEKEHLTSIYQAARGRELDQESSAREVLMRIFIAPDFIFKLEKAEQPGVHPVTAWELANRLSYFLWSSMPDGDLRKVANDGSLLKPEVLEAQTRRMLKDTKSEALAEEFAGQWLKFHGFSKHSTVDAGKFPEFTPELRTDMHREAQEFFKYLVREDRPVREILLADYTFLNERLAKHYGIPEVTGGEFRKVPVAQFHRGGILGMGSILTKTSFPQRTSPVLRGDWLLHAVLGMPTPPPPPDVPPFPEATDKPMTVRQRLEVHRADKACASCHDKIDPLGFALEGFDAIGRFREKDEDGLAIDDTGSLKDGNQFKGVDGLRKYLVTREKEFNALLARKLIGYSLGRSVIPSDKVLIGNIGESLRKQDGKFSAAILEIVKSQQFQYRWNE